MPATSPAIANEFIKLAKAGNRCLTQMQLQKLAYMAHGWNLAINRAPLVTDEVRAWDYGPVFPTLYNHAKLFGSGPVDRLLTDLDTNPVAFFTGIPATPYVADVSGKESAVIEGVWKRYGGYDAFRLSDLTHKPGTPWYQTYFGQGKNAPIPDPMIREHYLELARSAASQ